jgi:signal transduction histidine kinase
MDKPLRDLIEIIHFTEGVSTKIHGVMDKTEIYRIIREEFIKSKRYTLSISLLTDDGSKLRIAETSLTPGELKAGEKASGRQLKGYKIDLNKSSIYSQVIREGKTVQVNVSDIIGELFPRPLAYLISKVTGYEKKKSILTPLKQHGKIIGVFAMSSTDLAEYLIPSAKNLAQHISSALELAEEHAERKKAEKKIKVYQKSLQLLASELTLVEEQERRRIATELHDSVGQLLALGKIKLGQLEKIAPSPHSATLLREIRDLLEQTIEYARCLTLQVSPSILHELGLEAALEWLAEYIYKQRGIQINLEIDSQAKPTDEKLRVFLFRAVKELLLNVAKHAKTDKAKLSVHKEHESIRITVEDAGVGFNTTILEAHPDKNRGFGLFSIRENLRYLGGELSIQSKPGRGT